MQSFRLFMQVQVIWGHIRQLPLERNTTDTSGRTYWTDGKDGERREKDGQNGHKTGNTSNKNVNACKRWGATGKR